MNKPIHLGLIKLKRNLIKKALVRYLPVTERILSFIDQLDNPYMFKVGDINVKVSYNENGPTLQESLENILIKNLMQEFCHKNR